MATGNGRRDPAQEQAKCLRRAHSMRKTAVCIALSNHNFWNATGARVKIRSGTDLLCY